MNSGLSDEGKTVAGHLDQASRALGKVANPLSYILLYVGAVILTAMMVLVAVAVIMRYVFNNPILGDLEVITFMLVGLISFSLAYCAVMKGHVSVTVLVTRLPYRAQVIISFFMNLITLGFIVMIAWYSVEQAIVLWRRSAATIIFKVPIFPFALVLAFGSGVFALVMVVELLDSLSKAVHK
jgi:TRAP-type C4-dicarboxylate transport system permease small subunit